MKFGGFFACAVLAVSGVASAHAQQACTQLTTLMAKTHAQVKALQGKLIEEDEDEFTRAFKSEVAGFQTCKLYSSKARNSISDYIDHHLWCDGTAKNADAANQFVEQLWACTKESYTERRAGEAFLDGRYRIISFEGEAPIAGRAAGLVDFGETDHARVVLEKAHDTSDEYTLHLYWSYTE